MTYNVLMGTFKPTHSLTHSLLSQRGKQTSTYAWWHSPSIAAAVVFSAPISPPCTLIQIDVDYQMWRDLSSVKREKFLWIIVHITGQLTLMFIS